MLNLHIESYEIGCHVYMKMYFGYIEYYTENEIEKEIKEILKAIEPKKNFEEEFYKILKIKKEETIHCTKYRLCD